MMYIYPLRLEMIYLYLYHSISNVVGFIDVAQASGKRQGKVRGFGEDWRLAVLMFVYL